MTDILSDSTYTLPAPLMKPTHPTTEPETPAITQQATQSTTVQIDLSQKHLIRDIPIRGAPTLAKRKKQTKENQLKKQQSIDEQRPLVQECLSQLVKCDSCHIMQVLNHQLQFEEKHLIIHESDIDYLKQALIRKVTSIGVDFKSYFDIDAKMSLTTLLSHLDERKVCNTCMENIIDTAIQCAIFIHLYHEK